MKTIERYLDDMFAVLPQTMEVQQQKQRMLAAAEKEYHQLIETGVAPQTAVDRIIGELRSVQQQTHQTSKQPTNPKSTKPIVDQRMAQDLITAGKTNAFLKAGGVSAIIAGAAITNLLDMIAVHFVGGFLQDTVESITGLFFMAIVTFAILGFVNSKKKKQQFDFLNHGCSITGSGVNRLEQFLSRGFDLQKSLVLGILLCVFGVAISGVFDTLPMAWIDILSDTLMMLIESAGIFILIYRGQMKKLMNRIRDLLLRGERSDLE